MVGISSPAAVPIISPASFSGRCSSLMINSGMLMMYRLLVPHIRVQMLNSSSASRRCVRGASSRPVATGFSLRMLGKNSQTMIPQTINAAAALRYIAVKPNPIARA